MLEFLFDRQRKKETSEIYNQYFRCEKEDLFCVHSEISAYPNLYAAVSQEHICDGDKHCRNNEDEENCQGGSSLSLSLSLYPRVKEQ